MCKNESITTQSEALFRQTGGLVCIVLYKYASIHPSIQYIHTNMDQQCCSICCWRQMQPICSPYWSIAPLRNLFKTTTFSLSGDSIAIFIRRLCHFLCLTAIYCLALLNNKLCIEVRNASQVLCNLFWRSMPPDPP